MTNKRKKQTRELAQKLGIPYQAAHNLRRKGRGGDGGNGDGPKPLELAELLERLHTNTTFNVLTGQLPVVGHSSVDKVAIEQANDLAQNPKWFAHTGNVRMLVTKAQHELLVANGAAK